MQLHAPSTSERGALGLNPHEEFGAAALRTRSTLLSSEGPGQTEFVVLNREVSKRRLPTFVMGLESYVMVTVVSVAVTVDVDVDASDVTVDV